MQILKCEIFNGVDLERRNNKLLKDYDVVKSKQFGATVTTYIDKLEDERSCLDLLDSDY